MPAPSLFWDQLLQLIDAGRVVPLVGRDLLTVEHEGRQVQLYPLLAERLGQYLQVSTDELPPGAEINEVACRYLAGRGQLEDLYPAMKAVMPDASELTLPEPLLQLAEIKPLKLFVSTSFDDLLERALKQARPNGQPARSLAFSPERAQDLPSEIAHLDQPVVYHLFGQVSAVPLEYALTQEDTLEFVHSLQSETRRPDLLLDELGRSNLLILGSNFGGWLARILLRIARRQRLLEVRGITDYIADAQVSGDDNLVLFLRHFSRRTQVYEEGAAEFVAELHARWTELHPPGEETEEEASTPSISDDEEIEVFISYHSDDRAAAQAINDALEEVNLAVFFDTKKLRTGDDWNHKLKRSIARSALFIPIISANTLTGRDRYFRLEWKEAIERSHRMPDDRRFLVPVVIDETSMQHVRIPEEISKYQAAKLPEGIPTPEFVQDVVELYKDYRRIMSGAA